MALPKDLLNHVSMRTGLEPNGDVVVSDPSSWLPVLAATVARFLQIVQAAYSPNHG
jgi:hypothetical protein